ncbi:MAG: alginate export family protein [Kordiimonadaceae bacterium]|nr:alginate export family protein [Kordiimonadaceae bacterium]
MIKSPHKYLVTIAALLASSGAIAEEAQKLTELFEKGEAGANFRYRLESVDQDGFSKKATASTLLTKLWYRTASLNGFSGYIEGTNTLVVGKETYNNTVNGNVTRPVVADPDTTELNQAYLQYTADWGTLRAGRQGMNLDNQRFIGTVGWRQNDQTYDAITGILTPAKDITAIYSYTWNVNRIFGEDHPLGDLDTNTHALNLSYDGLEFGKLTAYGYFIDLNDSPVFGLSSSTIGVRFAGKKSVSEQMKLAYQFEYASQSEYKDNPLDYSANYWHVGLAASSGGVTLGANYELLGADNGTSFKTPLATLHKFNGWADKFLATPASGLRDVFVSAAYKFKGEGPLNGLLMKAIYHNFKSDVGDINYGKEWDFLFSKKIRKNLTASVKAAFYKADGFATDTDKIWLTLAAKF